MKHKGGFGNRHPSGHVRICPANCTSWGGSWERTVGSKDGWFNALLLISWEFDKTTQHLCANGYGLKCRRPSQLELSRALKAPSEQRVEEQQQRIWPYVLAARSREELNEWLCECSKLRFCAGYDVYTTSTITIGVECLEDSFDAQPDSRRFVTPTRSAAAEWAANPVGSSKPWLVLSSYPSRLRGAGKHNNKHEQVGVNILCFTHIIILALLSNNMMSITLLSITRPIKTVRVLPSSGGWCDRNSHVDAKTAHVTEDVRLCQNTWDSCP
eukprot:9490548-Pyramimonas_sp.AAC.1